MIQVKVFNNLYTQTAYYGRFGGRIKSNSRQSWITNIIQFQSGWKSWLNVGFDIWWKTASEHLASQNVLDVITPDGAPRRSKLVFLGPTFKIAPIKSLKKLSIHTSILIPMSNDLDGSSSGKLFVESDTYQWLTMLLYDTPLGHNFNLFTEFDFVYRLDKKFDNSGSSISIPLKTFLSYFLNNKLSFYSMAEFNPTPARSNILNSYYAQAGLGTKYQLAPFLEVEVLYTNFFIGNNAGAGQTYNIGIRFIH